LDYQNDVRLAVRDELPSEVDASDVAENLYAYMFMTEMTFPALFFGAWPAYEPDVCLFASYTLLIKNLSFFITLSLTILLANYPLSLGKGPSFHNVQR
jgi:hypothetical protein